MSTLSLRSLFLAVIACWTGATSAHSVGNDGRSRADVVYTMSNASSGNELLAFRETDSGALAPLASYPTGGLGAGAGLGSQGAIASDGRHIFVVNPGSHDLSVFRVGRSGLQLIDTIASGGLRPISVTVHRDLVYVLNAGSDNIAGFRLRKDGSLDVLAGSEQPLSRDGADPAQITFSADGDTLIVTEKAANNIVLYSL